MRVSERLAHVKASCSICAEAGGLSWPNWRRTQADANAKIAGLLDDCRRELGTDDCKVTLTGHSGGGSFMFGVIEGNEQIPGYIDRIAFLDANYSFDVRCIEKSWSTG